MKVLVCTHTHKHTYTYTHPLVHIHTLTRAAGGDASIKFWCRQRPGDPWQDTKLKEQQEGATSYAAAASEAPGLRCVRLCVCVRVCVCACVHMCV
jgi:hypothetical protein